MLANSPAAFRVALMDSVLPSWNDQALTGLAVIVTAVMEECLRERVKGGRDA